MRQIAGHSQDLGRLCQSTFAPPRATPCCRRRGCGSSCRSWSGTRPGCAPRGRPASSGCPLHHRRPRWNSQPDDATATPTEVSPRPNAGNPPGPAAGCWISSPQASRDRRLITMSSRPAPDRPAAGRYWPITIGGCVVQMAAVPLLAVASSWQVAALLIIAERAGKATRNPPRDAMLSPAARARRRTGHRCPLTAAAFAPEAGAHRR